MQVGLREVSGVLPFPLTGVNLARSGEGGLHLGFVSRDELGAARALAVDKLDDLDRGIGRAPCATVQHGILRRGIVDDCQLVRPVVLFVQYDGAADQDDCQRRDNVPPDEAWSGLTGP